MIEEASSETPEMPPVPMPVEAVRRAGVWFWVGWGLVVILLLGVVYFGGRFRDRQLADEAVANSTTLMISALRLTKAGRHSEAEAAARQALEWLPGNARGVRVLRRVSANRARAEHEVMLAASNALGAAVVRSLGDIRGAIQDFLAIRENPTVPPHLREVALAKIGVLEGQPCTLQLPDDWQPYTLVRIDGELRTVRERRIGGIEPGVRRIELKREGFRVPPALEIEFRGIAPVALPKIDWQLPGTTVTIRSEPAGAAVWRNGMDLGKITPAVLEDIDDGEISVVLKLAGHQDTTLRGKVERRRPLTLQGKLPELPLLPVAGAAVGERREFNLTADLRVAFRWIPAGTFRMGGPLAGEQPVREVKLTRGFWMAETEFTQRQWELATGGRVVSLFAGADRRERPVREPEHPMVMASWTRICGEKPPHGGLLGTLNGYLKQFNSPWAFDLPTEAQWEYACRAGTTGNFATTGPINAVAFDRLAIHAGNSGGKTAPVASREANPWGLHDMHGNVYEWCRDWHQETYKGMPAVDPGGPATAWKRVIRGGSFRSPVAQCLSASRAGAFEVTSSPLIGFRLILRPTGR